MTAQDTDKLILTLNAGSSSIKFAVYRAADEPAEVLRGLAEKLGGGDGQLHIHRGDDGKRSIPLGAVDHAGAIDHLIAETTREIGAGTIAGVGHRIAHGGTAFDRPTLLTDTTIADLAKLEPLAPLHQPHNLAAIAAARAAFRDVPQIGCFDTAFHRSHPWVNDTFALPRRFYDDGVRRYGFHGLSYDYITGTLPRVAPDIAHGRVVVCHLGNGASMCAIQDGKSVASTMGFSALDGLPMGTRCGQLDPGVILYLLDAKGMTSAEISTLLYKDSGLKGLSGLSNDMRELEASDAPEARQALAYFTFRIRRELGAMAAVLGGIDGLVFCGGIGENSARVRADVCDGMAWLGIALDAQANAANATNIGTGATRVLVIPTDEERVIARAVAAHLH
jgi:acetate kinase